MSEAVLRERLFILESACERAAFRLETRAHQGDVVEILRDALRDACADCSDRESMPDLGSACEVSCGRAR